MAPLDTDSQSRTESPRSGGPRQIESPARKGRVRGHAQTKIKDDGHGSRHLAPSRAMNSSATAGPQLPAG
jgi:hypothetical protein